MPPVWPGPCGWPGDGVLAGCVPPVPAAAVGWHAVELLAVGAGSVCGPVPVGFAPKASREPGCALPLPSGVPLPFTLGPLFPSEPSGPASGSLTPDSTLLLAVSIACRNGGTASVTLAIAAIPASTATGRIQLTAPGRCPLPPSGSRRSSGHGTAASRARASCQRRNDPSQVSSASGHAQCPRQVQYRTRSTAATSMLTSHGCGGRMLVLTRIFSSPSAPGSTSATVAESALRSSTARSSSGAVMDSPASPPRHHDVSCCSIDLSAAIARAV
jgi:hypothetical protein